VLGEEWLQRLANARLALEQRPRGIVDDPRCDCAMREIRREGRVRQLVAIFLPPLERDIQRVGKRNAGRVRLRQDHEQVARALRFCARGRRSAFFELCKHRRRRL